MPSSLYQKGTISVTNGSKTVTGAGTGWMPTDIRQGDLLKVNGSAELHFVDVRESVEELTLDTPWTGATASALNYTILRMSGDWGSIRVLGLEVAEYVRLFTANALTELALETALAEIEAALPMITTTAILESEGIPAGATGNVGDWAIDPATGEVWRKTGVSTWTAKANFKGVSGAAILLGEDDPTGLVGNDGDIYLNTSTSKLFNRAAGVWTDVGSFVLAVSLAEDAQAAAEAAQLAAETARDDAVTAKTGAEAAETAADGSAGDAASAAADAIAAAGAAAAAAAISGGLHYLWGDAVDETDPTAGKLKINHATFASATELYISKTDKNGAGIGGILAGWDDSTAPVRAVVRIEQFGTPTNFVTLSIVGTMTDNGTWDSFSVLHTASGGTLGEGDHVVLDFWRVGNVGPQGPATGVQFDYSVSTSDADPGVGGFRFNSLTFSAITKLWIDDLEVNGDTAVAWLTSFDDSTSPTRGKLHFRGVANPLAWAVFDVTGTVVNKSGYREVTLVYRASGGIWSDDDRFTLTFSPSGDAGSGSGDMVGPASAVDNRVAVFNGTSGKEVRDSGVTLGTAATANTGTGSGNVPVLDGSGRLASSVLPAIAITDTFIVANQTAMLALSAERGDIAIRSDLNRSFVLATDSPSTLADWKELLTPTDSVLSVAGRTGNITLTSADIGGLGNAATKNTGTAAGTVAAGDDSRITGAAQKSANLSDLSDKVAARTTLKIVVLTASAYAALSPPDADTIYHILA